MRQDLQNYHSVRSQEFSRQQSQAFNGNNELLLSADSQSRVFSDEKPEYMLTKIGELLHELVRTKQKVFYYEEYCKRLMEQNQRLKDLLQTQDIELQHKQSAINSKNITIDYLNQKIDGLQSGMAQLQDIVQQKQVKIKEQVQKAQRREQELLRKEKLMQQLKRSKETTKENPSDTTKIKKQNRQLLKIQKLLEEDLNKSYDKIVQLEKDLQNRTCSIYFDNISRLRDHRENTIKSFYCNQENVEASNTRSIIGQEVKRKRSYTYKTHYY